jgi:hypothetical protein
MAAPLGLIGLGSSIFGGILGAQGAEKAGEAQGMQNYYQAGIAQMNATIAKQNADYAMNVGEQQAEIHGMQGAQTLGHIIASQASSGLDVNTGTNRAVQTSQQFATALDTAQLRANAAKSSYDYTTQAANFTAQAGLYQMAGTNAIEAGQINAESSILGTVGSVASKWAQGSQVGLFNNFGSSFGTMFGA